MLFDIFWVISYSLVCPCFCVSVGLVLLLPGFLWFPGKVLGFWIGIFVCCWVFCLLLRFLYHPFIRDFLLFMLSLVVLFLYV